MRDQLDSPDTRFRGQAMSTLAQAIKRLAQTDGDHKTAIPGLTLHRRTRPTEPLHCIYNLFLASSRRAASRFCSEVSRSITVLGSPCSQPSIFLSFRTSRGPVPRNHFLA